MIFISYRHDDTKAIVTNLHQRLAERYAKSEVFVDYRDIPVGENWPDYLRSKLEQSDVLLVVVGSIWGDARFPSGKQKGRLRLDDPDDWVRQEVCTAIRRGPEKIRVVVVLIDEAVLPETHWDCELDRLPELQHTRLRNQEDFERDLLRLCGSIEEQIPRLRRIAEGHQVSVAPPAARTSLADRVLNQYVAAELRNHAVIHLPLISQTGQPVIASIGDLRIDLPLIVSHEHTPVDAIMSRRWPETDAAAIQEEIRGTHTSALLVDRASRFDDIQRDCEIGQKLRSGSHLVVIGDPGSGKSTLLQWIAYYHASSVAGDSLVEGSDARSLPSHVYVPIVILCRELAGRALPAQLNELLRDHLKLRQFSDAAIATLIPSFEELLEQGRAVLLVDALDEIVGADQRLEFARLLTSLTRRFPNAPIVVTSRVVGFEAVRDELARDFDHLVVAPLDRRAKSAFIEAWSKLVGLDTTRAVALAQRVCNSRTTAKVTDNIFMLAMVAQILVFDEGLPDRRLDIYRRTVELMIYRRRRYSGAPLSVNELAPHLEFLAYWMRKGGVQRCLDTEVADVFAELRRSEPNEKVLQTRTPEDLLRFAVDSVGLLNIAGTQTDRRGFDRDVVQFFHQSFQEYFAGQAIKHGRDGKGAEATVTRLRDLVESIAIYEHEVRIRDEYTLIEPLIAGNWQETVRLLIPDLQPGEADDAMIMLLPSIGMPSREARARAVFALQCLADEPKVSEQTALAVFDAAIDSMDDCDGINTKRNTSMDEALAAVAESAFGKQLHERLIEAFIENRAEHRAHIGRCSVVRGAGELLVVTPGNADALIAEAVAGLSSTRQNDRVSTALNLMNRCFVTDGKLAFLTDGQRSRLLGSLLDAFDKDESSESAVMWALAWLTGARCRDRGNPLDETSESIPNHEYLLINASTASKVEILLQRSGLDANTLAQGCMVLTRCEDYDPVVHQFDWIYELALVADGKKLRRDLPAPRPTGRLASLEWMKELLGRLPLRYSGHVAVAMGALGVFTPEMIEPLRGVFNRCEIYNDGRDEALVYLGLIGTPGVTRIMIEAADTVPVDKDDYLYARGLLGLLLLDDADVLASQIRKRLPHSDLSAYAFALAGSQDPRGRTLLEEMKNDADLRVRLAVEKALTQIAEST